MQEVDHLIVLTIGQWSCFPVQCVRLTRAAFFRDWSNNWVRVALFQSSEHGLTSAKQRYCLRPPELCTQTFIFFEASLPLIPCVQFFTMPLHCKRSGPYCIFFVADVLHRRVYGRAHAMWAKKTVLLNFTYWNTLCQVYANALYASWVLFLYDSSGFDLIWYSTDSTLETISQTNLETCNFTLNCKHLSSSKANAKVMMIFPAYTVPSSKLRNTVYGNVFNADIVDSNWQLNVILR